MKMNWDDLFKAVGLTAAILGIGCVFYSFIFWNDVPTLNRYKVKQKVTYERIDDIPYCCEFNHDNILVLTPGIHADTFVVVTTIGGDLFNMEYTSRTSIDSVKCADYEKAKKQAVRAKIEKREMRRLLRKMNKTKCD